MSDTVTYVLTRAELFAALWHTRRSTKRLAVQTVLLAVLGVPCLVGLFFGYRDAPAWLCGTVLPLLAVLQWVLPWAAFRKEAGVLATAQTTLTVTISDTTLAVENETVFLQNAVLHCVGDLVLWQVAGQWIVIPHRAVSEQQWRALISQE